VERLASAPDEYAFTFDRMSATEVERERTVEILDWAHHDLLELIRSASDLELDHADPERRLPTWAWWTTPRLIAWHIAITESRYYLPRIGLSHLSGVEGPGERSTPTKSELIDLLDASHAHVRSAVVSLPLDAAQELPGGEAWTSRKLLRRLAWHERDETRVVRQLIDTARSSDVSRSEMPPSA
jgi:hypothetical protein